MHCMLFFLISGLWGVELASALLVLLPHCGLDSLVTLALAFEKKKQQTWDIQLSKNCEWGWCMMCQGRDLWSHGSCSEFMMCLCIIRQILPNVVVAVHFVVFSVELGLCELLWKEHSRTENLVQNVVHKKKTNKNLPWEYVACTSLMIYHCLPADWENVIFRWSVMTV